MNKIIIVISIFIVISSCKQEIANENIIVDIDNNSIVPNIIIESIIPLETDSFCLIGEVTSLDILGDNIYILDAQYAKSIFLFKKNGTFQKKTSLGKAPHEMITPLDFYIDTLFSELKVYDSGFRKFNRYSYSLDYIDCIKNKDLIVRNFTRLPDSTWLVMTQSFDYVESNNRNSQLYNYMIMSDNFEKILKVMLPLQRKFLSVSLEDPISKTSIPTFCCSFDMTLYSYNCGELLKNYTVNFLNYSLTSLDCQKSMDYILNKQANGKLISNIQNINENDHFISIQYPFKKSAQYFIFDKKSKVVFLSQNIHKNNLLPKGSIKKAINSNQFVLVVDPKDFLEYAKNNKDIKKFDNPILILFKVII